MDYLENADITRVHYDPYNVYKQSYVHFLIQESDDSIDNISQFPEMFNTQDCFGLTPVHYAVEYRLYNLLCYLLAHGGNPCTPDIYGKTPLMLADSLHFSEMFFILQKYIRKKHILFKMKCIVKLLSMYRKSVESVWKPDGVGYLAARNHFESLL